MNDFNCGSGPSTISERLSLFKEIIRLSKKKEERTIVNDFTYQNVRVVELVAVLNYIIALYNFGLPVDNLYSIIEVYEEARNKPGSCYFYIIEFIEKKFKSIHPVLFMLDHYTKDIFDLLKDEGQMIGKFQFYIMAKAIASYEVHTQDVINNLVDRLNQYNKEITKKGNSKSRLSASSETTLVNNNNNHIESTAEIIESIPENVEIESTSLNNSINQNQNNNNIHNNRNINNNRITIIKEESNDDDTLIDNGDPENPVTPISPNNEKLNTTSVKLELPKNKDDFNLNIEKKSMIYECITSLNVYSKFRSLEVNIPPYPSDELIEKIESY
ncbi:hypothetical protein BCR32DRAFT_329865 [Anaeromyces robustus]|uniref:Uncharacterized protein n=1 Tax=Anaeromyces robustus TaxID=1754192 RepID=A0A1Y1WPJ2_9FUNG|nr:hypothetical protein BCR32DRAFT_329865 [Anaeromyces robustus]|eukprot:ORX75295.1 hypothetical protein BCR32DRAFT_329865 [Anaeromyces robustus]